MFLQKRMPVALLLLALTACEERNQGPPMTPAATRAGYAQHFPEELQQSQARFDTQHQMAGSIIERMPQYPTALQKPDWELTAALYTSADEEGKSGAYAEHQEEAIAIGRFYGEERKDLVSRITVSAEYAAEQKGCKDVQLYGATDRGLEKALEQQLEKRRRSDSDAHNQLKRHQHALGKKNVTALETQLDELSLASYVVHIGLLRERQHAEELLAQASTAESTLDRHIKDLKETAEQVEDPKDKQEIEEEIRRAEEAKTAIQPSTEKARQQLEASSKRIKELEERYEAAFRQLLQVVETAASEQSTEEKKP